MTEFQLFQMYHLKEMTLSAEFFLSCSVLQLTFYAIGTAYQRKHGYVILSQQIYSIGILILVLTSLLYFNEGLFLADLMIGSNSVINDFLSFNVKFVICLLSVFFLLMVKLSYKDELIYNNFEYLVLILISVLGLLLLCSSNDLITAYLSIELHSIAFYLMAAFKKNSAYSIESGLKYFIIGSLSSAFFLFGSSLLYGSLGTLNFDGLRSVLFSINSGLVSGSSVVSSNNIGVVVFSAELGSTVSDVINLSNLGVSSIVNVDIKHDLVDLIYTKENPQINYFILSDINLSFQSTAFLEGCFVNLHYWTRVINNEVISSFGYSTSSILPILLNLFDLMIDAYFFDLDKSFAELEIAYIGFLLICISIFIKLALAPFHLWSLDVYEGSPNSTTVFFAVIPKIALFVLLMRLCYSTFYSIAVENYQNYFILIGVLSIFVGSIGGLEQRKLKTLMAYSSVSHTGYLFLAFSMSTSESFQIILYYLVIFMVSGLCFWSVYLFLKRNQMVYFRKHNKELSDFVLLRESNPVLALIFAMTLFSIAGIPPLIGFLAKVGVFLTVVQASAYGVAVIAILLSITSTFYYIRIIKLLYFENILVGRLYHPIITQKAILLVLLSFSLIILCLNPKILYLIFYRVALSVGF